MICNKCNEQQSVDNFSWKNKSKGTRNTTCKKCFREYAKEHYQSNLKMYKDKASRNRKSYRSRGKLFIIEYLRSNPCVDCGEDDINVLEFDHKEPLNNHKSPRLTSLVAQSLDRIKQEISKCDVRCANCHTRKTRQHNGTLRT